MSESIEEIAKKEDPKNVCKKCLRSFYTLRGLNQHLRTCSKLIEEPKEPPDPPGKENKDSNPPLRCTWEKYTKLHHRKANKWNMQKNCLLAEESIHGADG